MARWFDLGMKSKMWKHYRQMDRQKDRQVNDWLSENLTWAFSSGEPKIFENMKFLIKKYMYYIYIPPVFFIFNL